MANGIVTEADVTSTGALPGYDVQGEFTPVALPAGGYQACRLFAVLRVWNEADIIEAAVRNCYRQGCEVVYLIDNGSDDDTVNRARLAGAELALQYETVRHTDAISTYTTNRVIAEKTASPVLSLAGENVWWLVLDADEFPVVATEMTLYTYLAWLNPAYGVVGARAFEHYPNRLPANIPGFHPADFQPYGCLRPDFSCGHHWKYPLLHFPNCDPANLPLCSGMGAHGFWARTPETQWQKTPATPILLHHVPYREPEVTRRRMARLCETVDGKPPRDRPDETGMKLRYRHLDQAYSGRWSEMTMPHPSDPQHAVAGIPVDHWSQTLPLRQYQPPRWYSADELVEAVVAYAQQHPNHLGNFAPCVTSNS